MSSDDLMAEHERSRREAMEVFRKARKMGGADFSLAFLTKLDEEISVRYSCQIRCEVNR